MATLIRLVGDNEARMVIILGVLAYAPPSSTTSLYNLALGRLIYTTKEFLEFLFTIVAGSQKSTHMVSTEIDIVVQ